MIDLPQNTGVFHFGLHFPAEEIHQNFYSLLGRQNLCDNRFQSGESTLRDLYAIPLRESVVQLFDLGAASMIPSLGQGPLIYSTIAIAEAHNTVHPVCVPKLTMHFPH